MKIFETCWVFTSYLKQKSHSLKPLDHLKHWCCSRVSGISIDFFGCNLFSKLQIRRFEYLSS